MDPRLIQQKLNSICQLNPQDLVIDYNNVLGQGSFGMVVRGTYRNDPVAVKILGHNVLDQTQLKKAFDTVENETKTSIIISSEPNCLETVPCYKGCLQLNVNVDRNGNINPNGKYQSRRLAVIMQLIPGTDLIKFVERLNIMQQSRQITTYGRLAIVIPIMKKLAQTLSIIHNKQIAHGDIKLENINYDPVSQTPYILDFGLSCYYNTDCHFGGTIIYQSPQILSKFKTVKKNLFEYKKLSDIWALGIVFYQLIKGAHPYQIQNIPANVDIFQFFYNTTMNTDFNAIDWSNIPRQIKDVILLMFNKSLDINDHVSIQMITEQLTYIDQFRCQNVYNIPIKLALNIYDLYRRHSGRHILPQGSGLSTLCQELKTIVDNYKFGCDFLPMIGIIKMYNAYYRNEIELNRVNVNNLCQPRITNCQLFGNNLSDQQLFVLSIVMENVIQKLEKRRVEIASSMENGCQGMKYLESNPRIQIEVIKILQAEKIYNYFQNILPIPNTQ